MQLPGAERAIVDISKLRNYVLSPLHPLGKHKAHVFASVLHIRLADAALLRWMLLEAALSGEAVRGRGDEYGQRYTLDFDCVRGERRAKVRSGWIVLTGKIIPG